ncbi:MAG: DUF1440 domain-containing protein [Bacteroidota bacterium]
MRITKQRYAFITILAAWLVTGTLDITTALIYYPVKYNITETQLLQNIASGLLGEKAFDGGLWMAALGLAIHYCIALFWTIVYFIGYPVITMLWRNRIVAGIAYGIVVWLAMNLVILPLSNVNRSPSDFIQSLIGAAILMICIGLPNSTIIGKYYAKRHTFLKN